MKKKHDKKRWAPSFAFQRKKVKHTSSGGEVNTFGCSLFSLKSRCCPGKKETKRMKERKKHGNKLSTFCKRSWWSSHYNLFLKRQARQRTWNVLDRQTTFKWLEKEWKNRILSWNNRRIKADPFFFESAVYWCLNQFDFSFNYFSFLTHYHCIVMLVFLQWQLDWTVEVPWFSHIYSESVLLQR